MPHPILLSKGGLIIKILPQIGATLVSLEQGNSGNILKSDPNLWDGAGKPALTAFSDFKSYNGSTVWAGPQSQWWVRQDLNPGRRDTAAPWPPDPFLVYGEYKALDTGPNFVVLESPESPISGIQIKKEVAINDDGSIYQNTTFTNTRHEKQSWDIWYNTRMDGMCHVFVPVDDVMNVRVAPVLNGKSQEMPFSIRKGFFSYNPIAPDTSHHERSSKAFIYPSRPWIAGFNKNKLLVVKFDHHSPKVIHPEQALVEIYNHTEHDKGQSVLELEYHSPYREMNPGDSSEAWEVWQVYDYDGPDDDDARIEFLDSLIAKGEL